MGKGALRSARARKSFCMGKSAFLTLEEAEAAQPGLTPYPCVACGSFHLTSESMIGEKPKKLSRTRKRERRYKRW